MAPPQKADTKQRAREQRHARLAAELRSNLRKRKEQASSRGALELPLEPPPGAPGRECGNDQPDAREAATGPMEPTGEVA